MRNRQDGQGRHDRQEQRHNYRNDSYQIDQRRGQRHERGTANHDSGYGYGSTQESRDFRNQSEDQYQSAMDFGSHTYDPHAHHGQSYAQENQRSQNHRNSYSDPRFSSRYDVTDRATSFAPQISHSGKGPKGYKRSDERIKEEVCDLIMRHDEVDGSDIEVEVSAGEVTLTGSVSDRSTKHLVENLIERTLGVGEVHNQLRVKRAEAASDDADRNADKTAGAKKAGTANPRH